MKFREATVDDIYQLHDIRRAVRENILSDPNLVLYEDYEDFIIDKGKGFVCEIEGKIVGFGIADLTKNNIWALFILPEFEKKGIGRKLHNMMLNWYFSVTREKVWLTTEPDTRAAEFYRQAGWKEAGMNGKGEVKYEMSYQNWLDNKKNL